MSTSGSDPADRAVVVPLTEETLRVEARAVPAGKVVVRKSVTLRDEVVEPLLFHDEVDVERVAVDRLVDEAPPIRQEGDTTIVPVLEEVLVVERRLLLKEEVRIVRRRREERRPQRVAVRSEEATVERVAAPAPADDREARTREERGT